MHKHAPLCKGCLGNLAFGPDRKSVSVCLCVCVCLSEAWRNLTSESLNPALYFRNAALQAPNRDLNAAPGNVGARKLSVELWGYGGLLWHSYRRAQ